MNVNTIHTEEPSESGLAAIGGILLTCCAALSSMFESVKNIFFTHYERSMVIHMNIEVLDCTLRDGGYCNNWEFGFDNIRYIVKKLATARIDIIELGFISDDKSETRENSIFRSVKKLKSVFDSEGSTSNFVCMCNYGEINFDNLEPQSQMGIHGIRLAFHKKDWEDALIAANEIKKKGYEIYLQPMVTLNYSDRELMNLIAAANAINPDAFYIVDSFGIVRKEDLLRMYYLVNHNLNSEIKIGYHSHNNMQLSYANAQTFVEIFDERSKIIDSSVFGMGRGAGNLNTELFIEHLNKCFHKNYLDFPLLQIIDNVLNNIYEKHYWGYSLPQYLSSRHNCHPNYASYLSNKNTLNMESINIVLERIPMDEKGEFNQNLIEEIYLNYQSNEYDDQQDMAVLEKDLRGKNIVLIAPGVSLLQYESKIKDEIELLDATAIGVNFLPKNIDVDRIFMSNQKRFEQLLENAQTLTQTFIATSNINQCLKEETCRVNYNSIRNNTSVVEDNAMLMILKLLIKIGVNHVFIAGMDGYSEDTSKNYSDANMMMSMEKSFSNMLNDGIKKELQQLSCFIQIHWITPSIFFEENEIHE